MEHKPVVASDTASRLSNIYGPAPMLSTIVVAATDGAHVDSQKSQYGVIHTDDDINMLYSAPPESLTTESMVIAETIEDVSPY